MKPNWKELASKAIASLSQNEREASIAYIEQRVIPAGEVIELSGINQSFNEPVVIAFIDLEPMLNWTHRACYLIMSAGGGILLKLDVDTPPFLVRVSPYLRLIHKGSKAPDWSAATFAMIR